MAGLSALAEFGLFRRPWSLAPRPPLMRDAVLAEFAGATTRVTLTQRQVVITRPWSEHVFDYREIKRVVGGDVLRDSATSEFDPFWGLLIESRRSRALDTGTEVRTFPMWGRSAKKAAARIEALVRDARERDHRRG